MAPSPTVWPHGPETLAIHHGSLDRGLRRKVEEGLRSGTVRCVVATSSLDLGVDFASVEAVIQIGSARGIARLLPRAGPLLTVKPKIDPNQQPHLVALPYLRAAARSLRDHPQIRFRPRN